MRQGEGSDHHEWVRRMRALARRDADEMVPRPDFPVLGLSAPRLESAALAAFEQVNGSWTAVTLAYGDWEAAAGPYVAVTSAAAGDALAAVTVGVPRHGPEAELVRAIDAERNRVAATAGVEDEEPAQPPRYSREELPAGSSLICRHGTVWAARLPSPAGVTVTVTGRGLDPAAVRLEPVPDLRPLFEARNQILGRLAERRREPPVLEPAEGVAAFRALAEFTLAGHARIRAAARAGRLVRQPANWGSMHGALWQRAVREQQRIAGVGKQAADEAVTSVINHLGHLDEEAAWFAADPRLREAAIDETLRHAVLGDEVRSLPAQRAWARYWGRQLGGMPPAEPAGPADRRSFSDGWLAAWAAWAASA